MHGDKIDEIRGRGFLRGIKINEDYDIAAIGTALRHDHLLVVPAGENTLRLLPPLIVSTDEIDLALQKFNTAIGDATKK
jgi:acetylornithine/N-succinyldiaminopimelate aminotransferase